MATDDWKARIEREDFSNPAFKGAYRKGFEAAMEGRSQSVCPYDPEQYGPQGVTFARAFWRHWHKGYDDAGRWQEDHAERNRDYWEHIDAEDRGDFFLNRLSVDDLREMYPGVDIPDTAPRVRVDNRPP